MIRLPGIPGVAFGTSDDGDARSDLQSRTRIADALGISDAWAVVDQVHGSDVVAADAPGNHGPADAMTTTTPGLPLAIGTADCVPVILISPDEVGIAHAGWRGVVDGVVVNAIDAFEGVPETVVLGPHIGPCCFEVGPEVLEHLGSHASTTGWGTTSVDLADAIRSQIPDGIDVIDVGPCTMCDDGFASYRRDGTDERQVSVVWR